MRTVGVIGIPMALRLDRIQWQRDRKKTKKACSESWAAAGFLGQREEEEPTEYEKEQPGSGGWQGGSASRRK